MVPGLVVLLSSRGFGPGPSRLTSPNSPEHFDHFHLTGVSLWGSHLSTPLVKRLEREGEGQRSSPRDTRNG